MIKKITPENFRRYGSIIEYPKKHLKGTQRNLWRIVTTESGRFGWRIAYLVLRDKTIRRLESHPHTMESFEPVRGKALFYVTKKRDLRQMECFLLDKPIVLKKGVWHGLVTLSEECEIKITENAQVKCVYWPLGFKLPHEKD